MLRDVVVVLGLRHARVDEAFRDSPQLLHSEGQCIAWARERGCLTKRNIRIVGLKLAHIDEIDAALVKRGYVGDGELVYSLPMNPEPFNDSIVTIVPYPQPLFDCAPIPHGAQCFRVCKVTETNWSGIEQIPQNIADWPIWSIGITPIKVGTVDAGEVEPIRGGGGGGRRGGGGGGGGGGSGGGTVIVGDVSDADKEQQ